MDYNKQLIRASFNKYNSSYDLYNSVQIKAAEYLGRMLQVGFSPLLLDLGAGNGSAAKVILEKHSYNNCISVDIAEQSLENIGKRFMPVCADIDNLPIDSGIVDLVISNMSLQWLQDIEKSFAEIYRVIRPGGEIAFSIPVKGSFEAVKRFCPDSFNELYSTPDIIKILGKYKLDIVKQDTEDYSIKFLDLLSALKSIRNIGAGVRLSKNNVSFMRAKLLKADSFFGNNLVPLDYKILYVWAKQRG